MTSSTPADPSQPRPPRAPRPYADAPRLPGDGPVDARRLVSAAFPATTTSAIASTTADRARDAEARLEIEIGPGRGGFLFERLAALPDVAMIGFEVRRKWAKIVDDRLARDGNGARARVFAEDAGDALVRLTPDASIDAFFLSFPDPWWKKRHAKRLVIKPNLLDAVARLLKVGGEIFVQTDVEERAAQYDALIAADARFAPAGDAAGSARLAANPYGATSHRERRAVTDGIPIYRMRYRRLADEAIRD